MSTIWENVTFNPYERQAYTKYELSSMVAKKRKELNLTIDEFANKFDISTKTIFDIEEAKRSFNVVMYRACSKILGLSIDEILRKDIEEPLCISFRKKNCNSEDRATEETVELANCIFHEMVMQHKINARS